MPNAIKYNTSTESLALKKGNLWIGTGDVGKGTTASTGFYNGITPPTGGYTIYLNKASDGPQIYTAANDTQLITLTNIIAGASYTTANECFNYFAGQSDKMVVNRDYETIVTDSLVFNMDAGYVPSYPKNNSVWYDNSSNSSNSTLYNGAYYSGSNGGNIVFDGTNDYSSTTAGQAFYQYTNQLTVSWWMKRNGTINVGSGGGQSTLNADNMSTNVWLMHGNTDNTVNFYVNDSGNWRTTTSSTLLNDTWYNITGTINTSNISIYTNANLISTSSGISSSITNNSNSIIGWGFDPRYLDVRHFNGSIAYCSVYNRALSSTEILQNFNALKGRFGL
jgi:hypothetical protein